MDRASAATAYTKRITQVVADLANAGLTVSHPLLEAREKTEHATLLVLTANRGLCGGYNGSVVRAAMGRYNELKSEVPHLKVEISGKRGIALLKCGVNDKSSCSLLLFSILIAPAYDAHLTAYKFP
jgi:F-type H+-transporting ATPase subunit gamma